MISLISSSSLKLYLNSLVYDRNMFGFSSKVYIIGHSLFRHVRQTKFFCRCSVLQKKKKKKKNEKEQKIEKDEANDTSGHHAKQVWS